MFHYVSPNRRLRNVTVTLEEDVAQWVRIEAARHDTSVSRLLGELLKERISAQNGAPTEAVERLAILAVATDSPCTELRSKI